ncbi:MAG: trypsin-like serine peptidase [Bacteriovoracales bacterium]
MFLILPLIFLFSCGKPLNFSEEKTEGVVVGAINWIEVKNNLRPEIISKTKPVADIYIPTNQSRCTGFLISQNILMTNYHCVSDAILAVGVLADFSHEIDSNHKDEYSCEKFLYSNKDLDFTLLECEGNPGEKLGFLSLESESVGLGDPVYMIHHNCDYIEEPACDYTKKLSYGKVIRVEEDGIYNTTDSLLGSSGSPVISALTGKVVGIHHSGEVTGNNQRGPYNIAIPSKKIQKYLLENKFI